MKIFSYRIQNIHLILIPLAIVIIFYIWIFKDNICTFSKFLYWFVMLSTIFYITEEPCIIGKASSHEKL